MKSYSSEILTPQTEEDIEIIEWANEVKASAYLCNTYPSIVEVYEAYKTSVNQQL